MLTRRGPIDTSKPRLVSDLVISQQSENGIEYVVIKDPRSGRFFRLKEREHYIAALFDGSRTIEDIAAAASAKLGVAVPVEAIAKFEDKLDSLGLLERAGDVARPIGPTLWQKRPLLQKILFWRIKAFNPDRLLDELLPLARIFYSRYLTPAYAVAILIAFVVLLSNRLELARQLQVSFRPDIIPLAWITVFVITLLHELSHGFACKIHGGKVSEMGFLLLYFQPCFYANVSDAYLFPEKRQRIFVTMAGIRNQIIVWALAILVWRITASETTINQIAFIIIALSFVGITFNLNPLLKLDGYYYLVDKWGIPNLRAKAFGYWKEKAFELLSGQHAPSPVSAPEKAIYAWYGLAAIVYSAALFGFILYKLSEFVFSRIGILGVAVLIGFVLYMIFEAMKKAGFWNLVMSEKGNILRPRNWIVLAIVLVVLISLSLIVKLDLKISQDCLIYPIESLTLKAGDPGSVELVLDRGSGEKSVQRLNLTGQDLSVLSIDPLVNEGDQVKAGQLIARIRSSQSEADLAESRANIDRAKSQLELLRKGPRPEEIAQTEDLIEQVKMKLKKSDSDLARSQELSARGMIPKEKLEEDRTSNEVLRSELDFYQKQKRLLKQGARPEEIAIAEAEIRAIQAKIDRLENQLAANNVTASINGVVTAVKTGSEILTVARTDTMRIRIPVPEKEISPVKVGQMVKLKARGYPGLTFLGAVSRIAGQSEQGELQPIFVVTAVAPNPASLMKPGMTGHAKIYCGKRPAYKVLLWRVVRWFRVEFWSWF